MLKAYFKMRIHQYMRLVLEIGLLRFLILSIGTLLALLFLVAFMKHASDAVLVSVFTIAILAGFHGKRRDREFLELHVKRFRVLMALEYTVILLPFIVGFIYFGHFIHAAAIIVVAWTLPFLQIRRRQRKQWTPFHRYIPDQMFEWKAGVRKYLVWIVLTYLAGLALSYTIWAVPAALILLGVIVAGFYENFEDLDILMSEESNGSKLLFQKIKRNIQAYTWISLPLILAFVIFNYNQWHLAVIAYLLATSLHIYMIAVKYTFYLPGKPAGSTSIFAGIGAVGILVPVFAPVVWLMTVYFYRRSMVNLENYLHDFN